MSVAREVTPMMTNGRRGAEAAVTPPRLGGVLLLEDEKDVAELIRYNLAKEGYGVLLTTNGPDALRLAREAHPDVRSEEHTSELQSRFDLVCRLLLEKKKNKN